MEFSEKVIYMEDYEKEESWKYVNEFIKELKTAKYWFQNDGNPKKEWKLFETRNAARAAARDADRDADRDAAWDAAWAAARAATRDADRDAAWDAARDAAWDAARAATRDADRDADRAAALAAARDATLFGRMLVCVGLRIEVKHLQHANARMEVWRKGYGLYCYVDGVLYVYKKI